MIVPSPDVADVVAADRMLRDRLAVIVGRPQADRDARQAGDRLDDAHELGRPEHAPVLAKARREIGDAHRGALAIRQHRRDDRGVAQIFAT